MPTYEYDDVRLTFTGGTDGAYLVAARDTASGEEAHGVFDEFGRALAVTDTFRPEGIDITSIDW